LKRWRPSRAFVEGARRFAGNRGALIGALILLAIGVLAAAASSLSPRDPLRIVGPAEIWPFTNWHFPLGTDSLGRNIGAMLVYGARTTLYVGLFAALMAMVIGVTVGALAGYYGDGWIDSALTLLTELFQTIPSLIFIVAIVAIAGPKLSHTIVSIGVVSWAPIARLTRAEFLSWRSREFVVASKAMGTGDLRLIFRTILPNAIGPVISLSSLTIGGAILFEAGISFLGLGDPNVATWGRLIGDGRSLIRTSWYISALPGMAILLTVCALSLISEGLSEMLDPKTRRS
jgi:peptide/nickel transport system permease protein